LDIYSFIRVLYLSTEIQEAIICGWAHDLDFTKRFLKQSNPTSNLHDITFHKLNIATFIVRVADLFEQYECNEPEQFKQLGVISFCRDHVSYENIIKVLKIMQQKKSKDGCEDYYFAAMLMRNEEITEETRQQRINALLKERSKLRKYFTLEHVPDFEPSLSDFQFH
jgi:hypothetical protein